MANETQTIKRRGPLDDPNWFGCLCLENYEQVAEKLRRMLEGRRYTFVAVHDGHPGLTQVRTSQTLRGPMRVKCEDGLASIMFADQGHAWGLHTSAATEQEARESRSRKDKKYKFVALSFRDDYRGEQVCIEQFNVVPCRPAAAVAVVADDSRLGAPAGQRLQDQQGAQTMKLAIADPPYPPIRAAHPRNDSSRARRWYDGSYRKSGDAEFGGADHHNDAAEWDDPARHRALLVELEASYDGWAIATAHDGLPCYGELPRGARVMVWHRPNGGAGAARIRNCYEFVIIRPHHSRLSSRLMGGQVPDLLTCPSPRYGFAGAKPPAWTRWVLDALGYDPESDTVDDLFPGSGSVARATAQGVLL